MTLRIGGFTSKLTEFFKERQNENVDNSNASSSLFDLVKNGETSSMSVDDLLSMDVKNGQFVTGDKNSKNVESNQNDLTSIINSYLKEEEVIKALDKDNSGNLSKNELTSFLNTIKGNDKNLEDISISDIYEASKQIDEGKFELEDDLEVEKESEASENKETKETEGTKSSENGSTESASGNGSNGGGGTGGVGGSGIGGSINGSQYDLQAEGNYKGMEEPELNSKMSDAENGIKEGQEALNAVLNGTNEAVAQAKQNIDDAYNSYQEELKVLNETMAKELDEIKKAADEKEQQLNEKKMEVCEQNNTVNECKSNYESAVSTRQSLESTLSSLQSALSGAEEEDKDAIEAQIASVEAQLEAAKAKEEETKTKLDEAKTKLETLKQQQTTLQTEKTTIDQQEMAKNQEIAMEYPQLAEKQTAYNEAKTAYDSVKATEESEANKLIDHNQNIKNNIQAEFTRRDNEDKEKENTTSIKGAYDEDLGQKIAEFAKNTLGSTGLCLAGVHNTLTKALGIKGLSLPFGSAYMAADFLRGDKEGYESVAQHFKEVKMPLDSNLPVGSIIVWDKGGNSSVSNLGKQHGHISIYLGTDANGNLKESSDHIGNVNTNRGTKYTVFIPV